MIVGRGRPCCWMTPVLSAREKPGVAEFARRHPWLKTCWRFAHARCGHQCVKAPAIASGTAQTTDRSFSAWASFLAAVSS